VGNDEAQRIFELCCCWSDETSLRHFEAFIAWHSDLTEIPLIEHPILVNERYTIQRLLNFLKGRHRQFVDVGCHLGESVRRLLGAGLVFEDYVLIEPDMASRMKLAALIEEMPLKSSAIKIIDNVVGMQAGTVNYIEGLGYCSQIWEHGLSKRCLTTLDELSLEPDLIKVHTEGSETEVLLGAWKTIESNRPALAFSIYHSRHGLTGGAAEVVERHPDYSWYFRMHSFQGTGAFVYGIPNDPTRQLK
jgi:FkbM family methyltransferase